MKQVPTGKELLLKMQRAAARSIQSIAITKDCQPTLQLPTLIHRSPEPLTTRVMVFSLTLPRVHGIKC